jgi:hypothetical protein
MRTRQLALSWSLVLTASAFAGQVYPIGGGTRTEPDPNDKTRIKVIAENEQLRLTLSKPERFWKRKTARMFAIYLRVENLSDKALQIQTSKFSAVDDEGRTYSGLEVADVVKRYFDSHSGKILILGGGLGARRSSREAAERKMGEDFRRESLQSGDIPPRSFKEGLVFFDAPEQDNFTVKVKLAELWPEPFTFNSHRPK